MCVRARDDARAGSRPSVTSELDMICKRPHWFAGGACAAAALNSSIAGTASAGFTSVQGAKPADPMEQSILTRLDGGAIFAADSPLLFPMQLSMPADSEAAMFIDDDRDDNADQSVEAMLQHVDRLMFDAEDS